MRIVIADDEYLVQESLISMIAEINDSWSIVGIASDGNELVHLIKEHQPDLAIVDIRMPYLSGLEAIRLTQNECPYMQSIVLTGYSEFAFAQEAIQLGASNYLLKPVGMEELKSSLEVVNQKLKIQNDFINHSFESAMISIVNGLDPALIIEELGDCADWSFTIAVFYVDSALPENEQANKLRTFYQHVKRRINQKRDRNVRCAFVFLPNGELALICSFRKEAKYRKVIEHLIEEFEPILQGISGYEFCLTMISTENCSFTDIKELMNDLQTFSFLRILYGVNKKWKLQDLIKKSSDNAFKLCYTIQKLVASFHERSHANYMNKLHELKTIFDTDELCKNEWIRNGISHYLFNTIQCQLKTSDDSMEWIHKLKKHGQSLLNDIRKAERPQNIIEQTLIFIENNFMHDISILQIADELQVTPNYLSTLFHKKMGDTFIKYLTRLRLIKAQELLADTQSQVQIVAEMVGYSNTRHFTKLFTEFTGCYPSVYKKSVSKKEELS